mgnify:CR=1 FL=1
MNVNNTDFFSFRDVKVNIKDSVIVKEENPSHDPNMCRKRIEATK